MGSKIKISDLARMMGLANQDLVFKLRSIGVRVEGDDAQIDSDVIQAILTGKKLPQPREVILRDETAPPAPVKPGPRQGPPAPARRVPPANPLRPNRPRTIIQTVDGRIKEIESPIQPERPAEAPAAAASVGTETAIATEPMVEAPVASEPMGETTAPSPVAAAPTTPEPAAARPAAETPAPPKPERPRPNMTLPPPRPGGHIVRAAPGPRPAGPGSSIQGPNRPAQPGRSAQPGGGMRPSPGGGRPGGPGGGSRPGGGYAPTRPTGPGGAGLRSTSPPPPPMRRRPDGPTPPPSPIKTAAQLEAERERERRAKRGIKKPGGFAAEADAGDLRGLRSLAEVENAAYGREEGPETAGSARRRRRQEASDVVEPGKVLSFKKDKGTVTISEGMTVREFADKIGVKTRDLIANLFKRGVMATINHVLDPDLAVRIAEELGFEPMKTSFEEETQLRHEESATKAAAAGAGESREGRVSRAPVVTIMGHVDHGKTSLLDAIRSSKLTEAEFGGITQHIGAYQVEVNGHKVVFLDTPGHEAFTMMRARGARVTDIVILVVAADDGVMPQTIEAINHARAAKVPLIVAINKIDKPNANMDRVKKELADQGVLLEDWGGDVVGVPISALKKQGIQQLLEMIVLTADLLELKASPEMPAQGVVLEARKDVGRGIVATVLVQNGTLRPGDTFSAGATWGRVRSMSDDEGKRLQEAGPATPIEITGFTDVPGAGDLFQVVAEEERARSIAEFRQQEQRRRELTPTQGKFSLEQLFTQIQKGDVKELPVVLKADVQGSVEVLTDAVTKLSTDKVKVQILHTGVGAISTNDVLLASASKAIIVGFNVRPERNASDLAEKEEVEIRLYTVIYELMDELRKAMTGLLSPTFREVQRGRAEVRETFKVPKVGTIAGCHVVEGVIPRSAGVRLVRDGRVIYEGKMASLRRFKDDASEVRAGFDCGIGLDRFQDVKPGDFIEAFAREEVAPTL